MKGMDLRKNCLVKLHGLRQSDRHAEDIPRRTKIILTGPIYAAFIGFSLCRSVYAPTLGELQRITGVTLEEISTVFTWLGAGGIAGSLTYGYLIDRTNPLLMFVISVVPAGLITIFIPWCRWLVPMMALCTLQAFFFTGVSIGCNVMMFRLWRGTVAAQSMISAMHFLFTIGGFLAPQICEPFIMSSAHIAQPLDGAVNLTVPVDNEVSMTSVNHAYLPTNYSNSANTSEEMWIVENPESIQDDRSLLQGNQTVDGVSHAPQIRTTFPARNPSSNIHYGYLIIGLYMQVIGLCMICLFVIYKNKYNWKSWVKRDAHPAVSSDSRTSKFCVMAGGLFLLFNIFFGGKEIMYVGLLYTFAVDYVGVEISQGTLLVSLHFATYGIVRFLTVFVASRIPPRHVVTLDILLGTISAFLLSCYPTTNIAVLWTCNILTGLSLSTVFCFALLWAETYLPITGRFTSAYVIAYTVGMMTWPSVTSVLYKKIGPMWYPHMNSLLMIGCCICVVALTLLNCYSRPKEVSEMGTEPLSDTPSRLALKDDRMMASLQSLHTI